MTLSRCVSVLLISAVVLFASFSLSAQDHPASDFEIFGGYSWYHPGEDRFLPEHFNKGWGGALTVNLNNWLGITGDGSGHHENGEAYTITGGPRFKLQHGKLEPFAEVLGGLSHWVMDGAPEQNHGLLITGLGLDFRVSRHFAIRPIQADYVLTSFNAVTPNHANYIHGVRLQAGVVAYLGLHEVEAPVSVSCSAEPSTVDAGMPVTITVTPSGFLPKRTLSYSYTSTGGKVSGTTSTATVDTTGLQGGSYTVTATVTDNGKGKHQRSASCQAAFTVKQPQPPTLSVTANPDTVVAGESSKITAIGSSPDNRPLTYSCNSTAGTLSGSGTQYTLDTTGAAPGSIGVNCTVTDDRNLSASASASVRVTAPAPPPPPPPPAAAPQPQANKFGAIEFKHDLKRPTRVDNEAKGELDRYADALAAAPDAKGVVVGQATSEEKAKPAGKNYAAQRAINTKAYLVQEKGIDPARIEVRTGSEDDQRVDLWVVPAGAQFPEEGTVLVDEQKVKAIPRTAPPPGRKVRRAH